MNRWITGIACIFLSGVLLLTGCAQESNGDLTAVARQAGIENSQREEALALLDDQDQLYIDASKHRDDEYRIVTTTVAITQLLDKLELDVVGIPTSAKVLPERYNGVTKVGNPMSPDMELVKSLKPTEVLSVTTLEYDLKPVFEEAGIVANFLDLTSVAAMNQAIVDLGERYDRQAQATEIITKFEQKVSEIEQLTADYEKPSVLILMGVPGSYLVATEHSYIGDLVRLAGGINIVQGERVEYLASNTEFLYNSNPDIILRAAHGMPEEVIVMFDKEFQQNDIWKHFNAVKNGRVYDLEEALFGTTASLYAIDAMDALLPMLYPELQQ